VVEREGKYFPIEVKLTDRPALKDAAHLLVFMKEYKAKKGLVVCPRSSSGDPQVGLLDLVAGGQLLRVPLLHDGAYLAGVTRGLFRPLPGLATTAIGSTPAALQNEVCHALCLGSCC